MKSTNDISNIFFVNHIDAFLAKDCRLLTNALHDYEEFDVTLKNEYNLHIFLKLWVSHYTTVHNSGFVTVAMVYLQKDTIFKFIFILSYAIMRTHMYSEISKPIQK